MKKKFEAKTYRKLRVWQERLEKDKVAYQREYDLMDERELLYKGSAEIKEIDADDTKTSTPIVRNIIAENIESQIRSTLPAVKVTAVHKEDEKLAHKIEDMLRNEFDRMQTEELNDRLERCVPLQGYGLVAAEWDNDIRTHDAIGAVRISDIHPRCLVPQDGVVSGLGDMDYYILRVPRTGNYILRKYGINVDGEAESDPEIRGPDYVAAENIHTVFIGFEKSGRGIDQFVWINDIPLEDIENYQARRIKVCKKCGAPEPPDDVCAMDLQTADGTRPEGAAPKDEKTVKEKVCKYCGGKAWEENVIDNEDIYEGFTAGDVTVPGAAEETREAGVDALGEPIMEVYMMPSQVPYYVPDVYPLVMLRNVSVYDKLGGESDCDKIATQQNVINRLYAKAVDRLLRGGSILSLPEDAEIEKEEGTELQIVRLKPEHAQLFGVHDLDCDISQTLAFVESLYEQSRQAIGITDSFQGRQDATASSGVAKQFAAAQSAGRLESKARLRNAAWARIGEIIFKFMLAYCDEKRPIISSDTIGNATYDTFDRYEFLKYDAAGEAYWNDMFLFSADDVTPLAQSREALWQEARQNFQSGAFGDPTGYDAKLIFWGLMEEYHYPSAGSVKKELEKQREKEAAAKLAEAQAQAQAQMQLQGQNNAPVGDPAALNAPTGEGLNKARALLNAAKAAKAKTPNA